jgi:hypothetical protein
MPRNRQALWVLWLTLFLAIGFALLLRLTSWHAVLAEANSQANLIRLQSFYFNPPPRTVLVGSSFIARLLPEYFENTGLAPVANLGLDGSSSEVGLHLLEARPPPLVIVEVNSFLRPPDSNDAMLLSAVHSFRFRLSRYLVLLRAQSRPSSILFSWLKTRRGDPVGTPGPTAAATRQPPPTLTPNSVALDPRVAADVLRGHLHSLAGRGSGLVLVSLPTGARQGSGEDSATRLGKELSTELRLPFLDLGAECVSRGITLGYSDGHHLGAASAKDISKMLAEMAARLPTDAQPRPAVVHAPQD